MYIKIDDRTAPQKWSQTVHLVAGCSIGHKVDSVILGSSYHTVVCLSVCVSDLFGFNLLFDAMKTGWNVVIDRWNWLVIICVKVEVEPHHAHYMEGNKPAGAIENHRHPNRCILSKPIVEWLYYTTRDTSPVCDKISALPLCHVIDTDLRTIDGVSGHISRQSHDWQWVFLYKKIRPSSFSKTLPPPP